jgi:hypothetical protein
VLVTVILVGRARDRREERAANAQVRETERE